MFRTLYAFCMAKTADWPNVRRKDLEGGTRGFAFASGMAAISADVRAIRAGLRGNVVTLFPDRGDRYISKGIFPADG